MSLAIATASGSAGQIVGPVVAVFLLESGMAVSVSDIRHIYSLGPSTPSIHEGP